MRNTIENQDKITKFMQAITDHAAAQSRQVHEEVEAYKRERLSIAEKQALNDSAELIKTEHAALQTEIRLEMSRRELNARQELLAMRREMTENIFQEAREKLITFTEQPAYTDFLKASFQTIAAQLPAEGTVYYAAAREEESRGRLLRDCCPKGAVLQFVKDIKIGGVRAFHEASGLLLDDTLDARLEAQRDWFVSESGLTVE